MIRAACLGVVVLCGWACGAAAERAEPPPRPAPAAIPSAPPFAEPPFDCDGTPCADPVRESEAPVAVGDIDGVELERMLARARCCHPELIEVITLGTSHEGRPILAARIGRRDARRSRPALLLTGGMHGSEPLSTAVVLDAVTTLLEGGGERVQRWLDELEIVAVPLVNPDGAWARVHGGHGGRKNGLDADGDGQRGFHEGVDLNRNFPFRWQALGDRGSSAEPRSDHYRGPGPGSEPEVRALMGLAEREHFVAALAFHTGTLAILAPYTIPHVGDPVPNEARVVAEQLAASVKGHPGGFVAVRKNLYPVDGTEQDWLRASHGTVALLVEGAAHADIAPWTRDRIVAALRPTWGTLADRLLDGPSLGGRVVDVRGRPLEAEIRITEIYRPEHERWTSRCRDGRFDRYLARSGSYTVRASVGDVSVEQTVRVRGDRQLVKLVLPVAAEQAGCAHVGCLPPVRPTTPKPTR